MPKKLKIDEKWIKSNIKNMAKIYQILEKTMLDYKPDVNFLRNSFILNDTVKVKRKKIKRQQQVLIIQG